MFLVWTIEQALKRLNIDHSIDFACDNGGIEIDIDVDKELEFIRLLGNKVEKRDYINNLYRLKSRKKNFIELSYKENYNLADDLFFYDVRY